MLDNLIQRNDRILPSRYDGRDFVYSRKKVAAADSIDLRPWDSNIEDQGSLGSCVSNAITSAYELLVRRLYSTQFVDLSRLFVYYNSRLFDNTIKEDAGTYIRDGLKAGARYGLCSEKLWPYILSKFDQQPTPDCYVDATTRIITKYETLYTIQDLLDALNDHKPVVAGMTLYPDFLTITTSNPIIKVPSMNEQPVGNHAVVILGYDLPSQIFLAKNSFGVTWGDQGYFWIPFDYMERYVFERWCFDINEQVVSANILNNEETPILDK